jgi:hypothetical protein
MMNLRLIRWRSSVCCILIALLLTGAGNGAAIKPLISMPQHEEHGDQSRGNVTPVAAHSGLYKNSHALVIGVSSYDHFPRLPEVAKDVDAVAEALERTGFIVEKLPDPTRDKLDASILSFINKWGENADDVDNRLLIYFSGHGITIGDKSTRIGYIVLKDSAAYYGPADNPAFRGSAVSMDRFKEYSRMIKAKAVLFVFDSCFSGYMFEVLSNKDAMPPGSWTSLEVKEFITAGTAEQEVPERSIFRDKFLEGINGKADYDHDGFVTGRELCYFLASEVDRATAGRQTPLCGKSSPENGADFVFVLPNASTRSWPLGSQYRPSGWMGDGEGQGKAPSKYLTFKLESAAINGKIMSVARIEYTRGNKGWAGIYWQYPEGNWGEKPGYNLSGARAISFWARGERGGEIVEFLSGGIEGVNKPYHDEFKKSLGDVVLSSGWQNYTIDLSDVPPASLKSVIGGFAWVGKGGFDANGKLVTYIADIQVVN